jgi:hypothetical protein
MFFDLNWRREVNVKTPLGLPSLHVQCAHVRDVTAMLLFRSCVYWSCPPPFLSLSMGPHWPFNSLLYNQYRDRLLFLPLTPKGYAPSSHLSILTERKKIGHIPLFALCLNSRNELTCVLIAKILWERKRDRRRENKKANLHFDLLNELAIEQIKRNNNTHTENYKYKHEYKEEYA